LRIRPHAGRVDEIHVAVGVIRGGHDRILIAQRSAGVHLAGFWEFPGGKVEARESVEQALRRELQEELGIEAGDISPLIQVRHAYPERRVFLNVWTVYSFAGEPRGRQGQMVRWVDARDLRYIEFPPANRPIATAARLPQSYGILDCEPDDAARMEWMLDCYSVAGVRLAQLRPPAARTAAPVRSDVLRCIDLCRSRGIELLLNGEPELAIDLGADGVHLKSSQLMSLSERPLPRDYWVAASCHNLGELRQAERIGVDFAVLSPVRTTLSHPGTAALGWDRFARLVGMVNLPVYALGGLSPADVPTASAAGAQGIAAIRGFLAGRPVMGQERPVG
jgi:8-oxo-dGTP diphosphatase